MKNKEQHYVPKLFLRRFSINNNQKTIGVFNVETRKFIINAPLKSQACEPYFYGRDGKLEAELAALEGLVAELLRTLSRDCKVPSAGSFDWITLLVFLISSELRTQSHIQNSLEMGKQLSAAVLENQKVLPKNASEMTINHEQAVESAMRMIRIGFEGCYDLKGVIIKNESAVPFITCDNPVVKYNQYLESRKQQGGTTGYGQIGLQIFFPIDSSTMLMLYDPWVYKIGSRSTTIIKIHDIVEVRALNMLSAVNCHKNIYFNHLVSENYLNSLVDSSQKFPIANRAITKSYYSGGIKHGQEYFGPDRVENQYDMIVHTYTSSPSIKLNLSFVTETKQAKKLQVDRLNFVKRPTCKMPNLPLSKGPFKLQYD